MTAAIWVFGLLTAVTFAAAGWYAVDSLLDWPHRREWVWPLHVALHEQLGYAYETHPRRYLRVPRDFQNGAEIVVRLPPTFAGDDREKRTIVHIIRTKLGLGNVIENWHLSTIKPYLTLRVRLPATGTSPA